MIFFHVTVQKKGLCGRQQALHTQENTKRAASYWVACVLFWALLTILYYMLYTCCKINKQSQCQTGPAGSESFVAYLTNLTDLNPADPNPKTYIVRLNQNSCIRRPPYNPIHTGMRYYTSYHNAVVEEPSCRICASRSCHPPKWVGQRTSESRRTKCHLRITGEKNWRTMCAKDSHPGHHE